MLDDFTPLVERISIDEAFLDVTGSVHLFGPPAAMADEIRRRVRAELGLPISVGVATTKHLAKVASQVAKPDGLVVVAAGTEAAFLDPLPVGLLWGVGPVTRAQLASRGITTIGALGRTAPATLRHLLGRANGEKLGALAVNADPRRIETGRRARSMGAQSALGRRRVDDEMLARRARVPRRPRGHALRAEQRAGRTVTVRVRFVGMHAVTRSITLPAALSATRSLAEIAVGLARSALADHPDEREVTLLAISVANLVPDLPLQLELSLDLGDDGPRRGYRGRRDARGAGPGDGPRA